MLATIKRLERAFHDAAGIEAVVRVRHEGAEHRWVIEIRSDVDAEILIRALQRLVPAPVPVPKEGK